MLSFKQFMKPKIPTAIVIHDRSFSNSIHESIEHNERLLSEYNFTPREKQEIREYGDSSFALNAYLLGKHHADQTPDEQVNDDDHTTHHLPTLDSLTTKKPLSQNMDVYSGLGFDPRYKTHPNNLIHFPAFTSTSLSQQSALRFATPPINQNPMKNEKNIFCIFI